ncbi:hypothetical protein MKW98_011910 [Papaver atlanticum]|uniref:Uncharacterized protein n=1 Tax=Papaver atlanticum TaxID=357466 RepID=A0AAD4T3M0_9MAGN|nr:hypothetical protein MKW98_011910 [Papaver atlanticum]
MGGKVEKRKKLKREKVVQRHRSKAFKEEKYKLIKDEREKYMLLQRKREECMVAVGAGSGKSKGLSVGIQLFSLWD